MSGIGGRVRAGAAAVVVAAGLGAAKLVRGGDDALRVVDDVAVPIPRPELPHAPPPRELPAVPHPPAVGQEAAGAELARDAGCSAIGALFDPESPGTIDRDELVDYAASLLVQRASVSLGEAKSAADSGIASLGINANLGPAAARAYLQSCFPGRG